MHAYTHTHTHTIRVSACVFVSLHTLVPVAARLHDAQCHDQALTRSLPNRIHCAVFGITWLARHNVICSQVQCPSTPWARWLPLAAARAPQAIQPAAKPVSVTNWVGRRRRQATRGWPGLMVRMVSFHRPRLLLIAVVSFSELGAERSLY